MIAVAARGAAARVTLLVLLAALARNWLAEPFGSALFVAALGVVWIGQRPRPQDLRWGLPVCLLSGLIWGVGLVLLGRSGFVPPLSVSVLYPWAIAAATVAVAEELAIRGVLQPLWTEEVGRVNALLLGAIVFSVIHLPRYGLNALPVDFAVGLMLGGLRLASGRVLPSAIAHVVADLGAYL